MPSRTSLIAVAMIAVLVAGATGFFAMHTAAGMHAPSEKPSAGNPLFYAEISTTSPPLAVPAAAPGKKIQLPILVYHIVRPSYPSDSAAVRAIAVTPETFDAQMNYLKSVGYHVVQFSDLENHFASGAPLPPHPVILSFDDGWSDQFKYAFPILQKYQYPATFFVFTNAIGRKGFLTWDDLHTLVASGMRVGDHTRSHPYLTSVRNASALWDEIDGSKLLLEKKLGSPVDEFAYPFGRYDPAIISLVRKAGYKSARGDYYSGEQSDSLLFDLSAINVPTTIDRFEHLLPASGEVNIHN
ncbi:MAG: polysaccharide deacetylase family protein [Minisyncoccota bacterium]